MSESAPTRFSARYQRYVLTVLLVAYTCNYVDRSIIAMLMEPVRHEFNLSDTQLGLLVGPAFVLFYALMGIPIARLADHRNRVTIISVCVLVWSAMVMLCGMAVSFVQLLIARMGVGVGEAGCTPPAHSLISDYFASDERTRAISTYMLGMPLGTFVSYLLGGYLNEAYGWRMAFILVGVPGTLLALVMKLTLEEPRRPVRVSYEATPDRRVPLMSVFAALWTNRALRHLSIAITLATIVTATAGSWVPSFLIRTHGMTTGELGLWLAVVTGAGGGLGMWFGGFLVTRSARHGQSAQFRITAAGAALIAPALLAALLAPTKELALILLLPANFFLFFWFGPAFAFVQGLSHVTMRATTVATLLFIQVLVGGFVGGQFVGLASSLLKPALSTDSLRWVMVGAVPIAVWSAVHFVLATRSFAKPIVNASRQANAADVASRETG